MILSQKLLWHLRWIILALLMAFSLLFLLSPNITLKLFLSFWGLGFALFHLLKMLEEYVECKMNCKI